MKIKNKVYIPIVVFTVVICFILGLKVITSTNDTNEENFIKRIEAIQPIASARYIQLDSLQEMIEATEANLIIRCTVISRSQSDVIARGGLKSLYTSEDLKYLNLNISEAAGNDDNKSALRLEIAQSAYYSIVTPYEIEILEVYHGKNIHEVGEKIVINARYGIVDNVEYKQENHPTYKVGDEYILFLRVDEVYGELDYNLAFTPASLLTINSKEGTFEYGSYCEKIFSNYGNNTELLIGDLKNLIEQDNRGKNVFNNEIEKFDDMEHFNKLFERKRMAETN